MRKIFFAAIILSFLASTSFVQGNSPADTSMNIDGETVVVTVDSTNFRFTPSQITIDEGQSVRFFWNDEVLGHNAVEENGFFDSGNPQTNVDYTFKFEVGSNGTYTYVCEPHELMGMEGFITVNPIVQESEQETTESSDLESSKSLPNFLLLSTLCVLIFASMFSSFNKK